MIRQAGLHPHQMHCTSCGLTWLPRPARGKGHPTDSSLDREAAHHWQTCTARATERRAAHETRS